MINQTNHRLADNVSSVCYATVVKLLILHDIRSAYNVGAMFRTADGAGVNKIYISGYTPRPVDRFGRTQGEIEKTSLGASLTVPWEDGLTLSELIKKLQSEGVKVVAVEQTEKSIPLASLPHFDQIAYVVGNEIDGVAKEALELADVIVDIPMLGEKESLNVSVAAGIVLYHDLV